MLKAVRKIRRAITRDEPDYYDMYLNKGERFFARLYLHHIRGVIREQGMERPWSALEEAQPLPAETSLPPARSLKLLDAGCQAGRLAIPLAQDGHQVTGVDTSSVAVHKAQQHARNAGVTLRWVRADMGAWLPKQPAGSFDAVLCNEVLYLRENWRELLQGLIRLLRPGGLCFISHRPPAFYLAEATQHQDQEGIRTLRSGAGEGRVLGSYYNWQKQDELRRIYEESGIQVLKIVPIWQFSQTVNPSTVTEEERERLFQEEISAAASGDGRYLLVCGRKR